MRLLHRLWEDVRRGENIDLYATIVIAFAIIPLGFITTIPAQVITSLTLVVLGLLAISNLVNRHRVEEVAQKLSQSSKTFFTEELPPDFKQNFEASKETLMIGVGLSVVLKNNYKTIEDKLRKGHVIRVLLVHPEGAPVEMAASRYYAESRRDAGRTGEEIKSSLQLFCSLKKIAPKKMEIRTIQNPLTFGAIYVNSNSADGILYIEHYPYRTASGAFPKFALHASDGYWYEFFKKEVGVLWDNGLAWECTD
jgi:hypothetical protein